VIDALQSAGLSWSLLVFPVFGIGMMAYAAVRIKFGSSRWLDLAPPVLFGLVVWSALLLELPDTSLVHISTEWIDLNWGVYVGVGLAPIVAAAAYFFELWLATKKIAWERARRSSNVVPAVFTAQIGGMPVSGITPMSGAESFALVGRLSSSTTTFMVLSVWTMLGEELLYRGVLLNSLKGADYWGSAVAWGASSMLYGLNHIPFGVPAFVGKVFAGLLFAGLAILGKGSIVACLLAHLLLQVLVFRRFRKFS